MKRMASSDSMSGLITVGSCQEKSLGEMISNNSNSVYNRGYQSMLDGLDEDDGMEESGHVSEKKRRLSVDQVKALEKNFEVENKLEPDRKVKLAQELGLQPRQVAVWFQNRRARWKTKQLERDYGLLKTNYDALKLDFESLKKDNEALLTEVKELKSKLQDREDDNTGSEETYIKKEIPVCESMMVVSEQSEIPATNATGNHNHNGLSVSVFREFKDGSSDSDSSAILNEENNTNNGSPNAAISSSGVLNQQHMTHHMSPASSPLGFNCSSSSSPPPASSSINGFQFSDHSQKVFQNHQFVRMEEHNFFGAEETCNFFSDDQAPTLQWYYSADQWN